MDLVLSDDENKATKFENDDEDGPADTVKKVSKRKRAESFDSFSASPIPSITEVEENLNSVFYRQQSALGEPTDK